MLMKRLPNSMSHLHADMEHLVNDLLLPFGGATAKVASRNLLPVNIWETEEAIHVESELPGVEVENLEIEMHGRELTIRGTREGETSESHQWRRRERRLGEFSRTLKLPALIDSDGVEATLKQGILSISLKKAPENRPRKIEVKNLS